MKTTAEEIRKAQNALERSGIVNVSKEYDSVFGGYISSFGASLVQAGLLPTIIFYEKEDSDSVGRPKTIAALKTMMNIDDSTTMAAYILTTKNGGGQRLCDDPSFVSAVVRNMTALKLALRMYKKKNR